MDGPGRIAGYALEPRGSRGRAARHGVPTIEQASAAGELLLHFFELGDELGVVGLVVQRKRQVQLRALEVAGLVEPERFLDEGPRAGSRRRSRPTMPRRTSAFDRPAASGPGKEGKRTDITRCS